MESREMEAQIDDLLGAGELAFPVGRVSRWSALERVWLAWDEAQTDAAAAYAAWLDASNQDGYVVYRAAQDRADVAQDALARGHRTRGADVTPPGAVAESGGSN